MQQEDGLTTEQGSLTLMMNSVIARVSRVTFKELSELGLNVQSARVLIILLEQTGVRCAALARLVGLEATALSHLLRLMADQGLVVRERVREDHRAVEVRLTSKGRQMAMSCRSVDLDKQRMLLRGVDPDDVERFASLLSRMSENLDSMRIRNGE